MIAATMNPSKPATRLPTLDQVIAWIESGGSQWAYRFEPKAYIEQRHMAPNVLREIIRAHNCDTDSARVIYASSFGMFQVMGFNLYWPPILFEGTFGEYLADRDAQVDSFYEFVRFHKIDFTVSQLQDQLFCEHFAVVYNGSVTYADKIRASLQHFGVITS